MVTNLPRPGTAARRRAGILTQLLGFGSCALILQTKCTRSSPKSMPSAANLNALLKNKARQTIEFIFQKFASIQDKVFVLTSGSTWGCVWRNRVLITGGLIFHRAYLLPSKGLERRRRFCCGLVLYNPRRSYSLPHLWFWANTYMKVAPEVKQGCSKWPPEIILIPVPSSALIFTYFSFILSTNVYRLPKLVLMLWACERSLIWWNLQPNWKRQTIIKDLLLGSMLKFLFF